MSTTTISQIEKDLIAKAYSLVPKWFPGGTWKHPIGTYYAINHVRKEKRCSMFIIHTRGKNAGCWADFMAADVHGTSLLQLCAYSQQIPNWNSPDTNLKNQALLKAAQKLGYGNHED